MARQKDEYKDSHVIKQARRKVNWDLSRGDKDIHGGILYTCLYVWKFSQ